MDFIAITDHGQLDPLRATQVENGVEGRADRAARVEHVVHENDRLAGEVDGDEGAAQAGGRPAR